MYQLLCVKITQLQMVHDRGYVVPDAELPILNMNVEDFIRYLDARRSANIAPRYVLTNTYFSRELYEGRRKIMVVYYATASAGSQTVSLNTVGGFIRKARQPEDSVTFGARIADEAIMISDVPLSHDATKEVMKLTDIPHQLFRDEQLTYNPTLHNTVPVHRLLTPEEAIGVQIRCRVAKNQLPIIRSSDPIVKYYGWQSGNIVEIHRVDLSISLLSEESTVYRIIV